MTSGMSRALAVGLLAVLSGCAPDSRSPAAPLDRRLSQASGTLQVPGLADEVRIVRDHWGIPHIYATNADDLFFAQGFVQAQDRLFQIDLWRRSTQGRLAEILGAAYVDRDRLTRLMRYRGDINAEWESYAPDTRRIATRFVAGINAQIAAIGDRLPEEFAVAGYRPGPWQPEDLLSRAEGFAMTSNASDEVFRARMTAAVGLERTNLLLPLAPLVPAPPPTGIDLSAVDATVRPALAAIGAPASFGPAAAPAATAFLDWQRRAAREGSNDWVISGEKSATGKPMLANDPHRNLDHPSLRYLVHLNAPGWNVIGSVVPWFPGVAIGHNDRIAWGLTIFAADVQDLYVEELNPDNARQVKSGNGFVDMEVVKDQIRVQGRTAPVAIEHLYTAHGPVVAIDAQRHLAYALRWVGGEPGTAGYLGALALDRAANWPEFRSALRRWKVPGENFVYADVDGNIGYQAAALVPVRRNWEGVYPVAGATGDHEWQGWRTLDELPHAWNPDAGFLATANDNTLGSGSPPNIGYSWSAPARINRIREVLGGRTHLTIDDLARLQHDATSWNAEQLLPLLQPLSFEDTRLEQARQMLVRWDRRLTQDSPAAALYVAWEQSLFRQLVERRLDPALAADYIQRVETNVLVPALTKPSAAWFGASPAKGRDQLLQSTLAAAVAGLSQTRGADMTRWTWGQIHTATFQHPLAAMGDAARLRFNVGPFPRAGYGDTVFATGGSDTRETVGATFREVMDLADWDRSIGTSAPGQSGQPGSPHFNDLATLWAAERYFPYSFSQALVEKNAEATLVLRPRR